MTNGAATVAIETAVAAGATPVAAAGAVATKVLAASIASGPAWPVVIGVAVLGVAVSGGIAWYKRSSDRTYAAAIGQGISGGAIATATTAIGIATVSAAQSLPSMKIVHEHKVPDEVCVCLCVLARC